MVAALAASRLRLVLVADVVIHNLIKFKLTVNIKPEEIGKISNE